MNLKVYIIILNWNGWQDTIACLDSILQLNYSNYKIIICDNNSTDDSIKKILDWGIKSNKHIMEFDQCFFCLEEKKKASELKNKITEKDQVVLIQTSKNLGYAGGNNFGIKFAMEQGDMDYVWILNNDTVVDENSLINLVKKCELDINIGICGSRLMDYDFPNKLQSFGGGIHNRFFGISIRKLKEKDIENIDYVIGASMLVRKNFIELIGLMEEKYFLYYEELDWAIRAKGVFKLGIASESIVYHKDGSSINAGETQKVKSKLSDYYLIRNRILFTKKFYSYCLPIVYLGLIFTIIRRIKRKQFNRIWMITKLMLNPGKCYYDV